VESTTGLSVQPSQSSYGGDRSTTNTLSDRLVIFNSDDYGGKDFDPTTTSPSSTTSTLNYVSMMDLISTTVKPILDKLNLTEVKKLD